MITHDNSTASRPGTLLGSFLPANHPAMYCTIGVLAFFLFAIADGMVVTDSCNAHRIIVRYVMQNQDYRISMKRAGGEECASIVLNDASHAEQKGEPDLPRVAQAIVIPDKNKMKIEITASRYTEQKIGTCIPSKGSLSRRINPEDVPYSFGPVYSRNAWFPGECAYLGQPYIAGDYRGIVVYLYPFQYNPANKTVRVYSEISVKITPTAEPGINEKTRIGARCGAVGFEPIVSHACVTVAKSRYTPLNEEGSMLVISHKNFIGTMQPFVDWKNKRGIKTELVDAATIGTTAKAIKKYVADYYKDSTKHLKYLLLVGDVDQIPTLHDSSYIDPFFPSDDAPSDNMYGMIEGNDAYMEIFVGRFSGTSVDHIQAQVDKTLYYERHATINDTWLTNAICTADGEEPDDQKAMDSIIAVLKGYGYANVNKYTKDADAGKLTADVNNGVGFHINSSHGEIDYITALTGKSVSSLKNSHKYPFNYTLACLPGKFNDPSTSCLGELILRKQDGGYVGAFMATIQQDWDEPYPAIREHVNLLTEKYPANSKRTFGGIAINGCFKMLDIFPKTGICLIKGWEVFGDPNLHIYTKTPLALTVTHPAAIGTGTQTVAVNGTDSATVCLYSKKMGIQKTLILSSGKATFSLAVNGYIGDTVYVTGTMFNHTTYEGAMIVRAGTGAAVGGPSFKRGDFAARCTATMLHYQIPEAVGPGAVHASVRMFSFQGKPVSCLVDALKGPGRYSIPISKAGSRLPGGTYLCAIEIGDYKKVTAVIVK